MIHHSPNTMENDMIAIISRTFENLSHKVLPPESGFPLPQPAPGPRGSAVSRTVTWTLVTYNNLSDGGPGPVP